MPDTNETQLTGSPARSRMFFGNSGRTLSTDPGVSPAVLSGNQGLTPES
jgi:hypothetical protein